MPMRADHYGPILCSIKLRYIAWAQNLLVSLSLLRTYRQFEKCKAPYTVPNKKHHHNLAKNRINNEAPKKCSGRYETRQHGATGTTCARSELIGYICFVAICSRVYVVSRRLCLVLLVQSDA